MGRKIIVFLFLLSLWYISSLLFPFNSAFYNTLSISSIIPSIKVIKIIWFIVFICNTLAYYFLIKDYDMNDDFNFVMILNYMFCELYPLFFFFFNSLTLSMICSVVVAVSTIFLFNETKKINKQLAYLFIPYLIWGFISLTFSISIYLIN